MVASVFGAVKEYHQNEMIFKEGQNGNEGYLIKSGKVTIYLIDDNGKKILNELLPGQVFGEMAALRQAPRSANAVASEYTELVVIDKKTLFHMLEESPKIIQSITHALIERLINLTEIVSGNKNLKTEDEHKFFRICQLLEFVLKSAHSISGDALDYNTFCYHAIDIVGVSRIDIDNAIKRVSSFNLLELSGDLRHESHSKIKIKSQPGFLNAILEAYPHLSEYSQTSENE